MLIQCTLDGLGNVTTLLYCAHHGSDRAPLVFLDMPLAPIRLPTPLFSSVHFGQMNNPVDVKGFRHFKQFLVLIAFGGIGKGSGLPL